MALKDDLKNLLSDVVSFYFRAHGHHWNVEGEDFSQYHALFQEIYEDAYSSIDPIAENIRKLGDYSPFRLERFIELANIPDSSKTQSTPKSMAQDLLKANEYLIVKLKDVFSTADTENEQGIANFIAERIDMHQKWAWQLKASLK
ncbi:MAG: DNA starvation/stationary phase protection protein [Microbacteriaceae bacterium]|nr:DNA starvation/stationary phase protection protein [Microbacteriaceae bacterium]